MVIQTANCEGGVKSVCCRRAPGIIQTAVDWSVGSASLSSMMHQQNKSRCFPPLTSSESISEPSALSECARDSSHTSCASQGIPRRIALLQLPLILTQNGEIPSTGSTRKAGAWWGRAELELKEPHPSEGPEPYPRDDVSGFHSSCLLSFSTGLLPVHLCPLHLWNFSNAPDFLDGLTAFWRG